MCWSNKYHVTFTLHAHDQADYTGEGKAKKKLEAAKEGIVIEGITHRPQIRIQTEKEVYFFLPLHN